MIIRTTDDFISKYLLISNKKNYDDIFKGKFNGIFDFQEINNIVRRFFCGNSNCSSTLIWNISKEKYKEQIEEFCNTLIDKDNRLEFKKIKSRIKRQFETRIYKGAMLEAITYYNLNQLKDYSIINIKDIEDKKNKIDFLIVNKDTGILIPIQIKSRQMYNSDFLTSKIENEKRIQKDKYGLEAEYLEYIFDEYDRNKRRLIYYNSYIDFKNTFGRSPLFNNQFEKIINKMHKNRLNWCLQNSNLYI